MLKNVFVSAISSALLLAMLTACADDNQNDSAVEKAPQTSETLANTKSAESKEGRANRPQRTAPVVAKPRAMEAFQSADIMNQAVDFSTPESIAASMQAIEEKAGEIASSRIEGAINYLLVYDLSVGRDKQKLYAKLNGKTPNDIIAMTNR